MRDRKRERNSKVERIRVCVCVCLCKREMERVGTESVNAKTFYSLHQIFYQGLHSDYICVLLLKAPCHGRPISLQLHYRLVLSFHSHPILHLILVWIISTLFHIALLFLCYSRHLTFEQVKAASRLEEEFQVEVWGVVEGGETTSLCSQFTLTGC